MDTTSPVKDLDHLLQETLGPDLKVGNVICKPLTDPGENYGSLIYSVDATIIKNKKTEILNLVVKMPPPSQYLVDLFNSPMCFWKELVFYREIAPKFIQLQSESGIDDEKLIRLIPQFYGGRLGLKDSNIFDDQAAVIMENLMPKGYSVHDRLLGLDLEHTELVVRELAKLHAIVIGLKIKNPEFFKETVLPALVDITNDVTNKGIMEMLKEAHNSYKEFPEAKPYIDHINRTLIYDYERDNTSLQPSEPWRTMVHNDLWSNNVMFRYNNEHKPIGIKIVDFQLGYYGSGVMDLIFFLISSVQNEVLDNNLNNMFDYYYESFKNCLTTLKVNTEQFSRENFDKEIDRCAPLQFGHCIFMVSVITAKRGAIKSIEEVNRDVTFSSIGDTENAKKKLLHILKIFNEKQWLVN